MTVDVAPRWVARLCAGTPTHRDRSVDALRAVAIVGVIVGHWLVTAVVSDPYRPTAVHGESPLSYAPWLAPATWLLQTLGPFFVAGGYAAALGSRTRTPLAWLGSRLARLARPVLLLAAVWVPALVVLAAVDAPTSTRRLVWSLVCHPLWFLAVYLVLSAFTPVLRAAVLRWGPLTAAAPAVALVALTDVTRSAGMGSGLSAVAAPLGWAVPYLLGIALAEGRLTRRDGAPLLALGVGGGAALVLVAGYPASAVGVPGDGWSNLDPPSLFAVALAAAQLGLFLLLRPWLVCLLRRPGVWAPVAVLNITAMSLYCWHQSALLLVTFAGLLAGRPAGLLDDPTTGWIGHRLAWLPVFAIVLAVLVLVFHPAETGGRVRAASR